ncbi:MAG: hypothetical protein D6761_06140 [Candidatus Dadabacteria bacterium]|nr:MAG: hypothetical protein D6761_06140 [Candidatus Dadabacteria bacterium]
MTRCLECGHTLPDAVTTPPERCPHCGSTLISTHGPVRDGSLKAAARSVWDDTGPGARVVRLPVRPQTPDPLDFAVEAAVWWLAWLALALALGVERAWQTWVACALAVVADITVLRLLDTPPIWRAAARRPRPSQPHEQPPRVSNL